MEENRNRALTLKVANATVILLVAFTLVGCEKARLDAQVRELCARDGGVRVYEIVKLPPERFNQWGQVTFFNPTQGEASLGPDYIFKEDIRVYESGNPRMARYHYQVIRRSDGKLLGETTYYVRGGGDLPGPWHESSFACPNYKQADSLALLSQVFVGLESRGGK